MVIPCLPVQRPDGDAMPDWAGQAGMIEGHLFNSEMIGFTQVHYMLLEYDKNDNFIIKERFRASCCILIELRLRICVKERS